MNEEETFLREIERRLEENRRLAERSFLPKQLSGVASYLGFHTFTGLVGVSLGLTILAYSLLYERLMQWGKLLFLMP